jgi:putative transposase
VIGQIITEAHAEGLTVQKACAVIGLSPRTLQRWRTPAPAVATVPVVATPATPRPRPHNALTEREAATVVALIQSAHHADASCRELALALEQGPFPTYVSHVTIWAYQCALHCNGPRGRQGPQGRRSTAPDTTWVNGPNRLWDWDVTFLATSERSRYLYLYSLLDHWSRKNIAWLIGEQFTSTLAQTLWDQGLIQEGLLDQPTSTWPKSLSDCGQVAVGRSRKPSLMSP